MSELVLEDEKMADDEDEEIVDSLDRKLAMFYLCLLVVRLIGDNTLPLDDEDERIDWDMTELLPINEDIADGEDGSDEEIEVLDEDSL